MSINNKNTYQRCICTWCLYRNTCEKDKYITADVMGKITMRCAGYEYDKSPEVMCVNK